MNKIISMILLCALLLSCFAGCATPKAPAGVNDPNDEVDLIPDDDKGEENSDNEIDSTPNDNENEENPDNEIDATPDDNAGEKNPDNEADPTPDDDTDEQEPVYEVNLMRHDHGEKGSANNNAGNSIDEAALKAIFEQLRADADANAKLEFWVAYEQEYYELKNSDEYANCDWKESCFIIVVSCCYDCAAQYEDWYQQCSTKNVKSLNEAFYQQYGANITNGQYSNIVFSAGMHFVYLSLDGFSSDYEAIKALLELSYVKQISIWYNYGLPDCYFLE